MDTTKQPGILFDDVILKELVFSRKEGYSEKPVWNIHLDSKASISPDKDQLVYEMTCEVMDDSNFFNVKCVTIGIFSVIKGKENIGLREFAKTNAATLIFPYVRETISSITTKAGIPPVVIPPVYLHLLNRNTVTTISKKETIEP